MYNPFSPIYGGKPNIFFGREEILSRFDTAMRTQGSLDRAIYLTGMRASGKTTLLEKLSELARSKGRRVFDLGPDDTVDQLLSELVEYDELTKTVNPSIGVTVLGSGGTISGTSVSHTTHYGREHLQSLLIKACERAKHGVFITIDEIQKIEIDDVSAISNAVQMASRKGYDIMLAVASLPSGYDKVIHHDGCTFLRRATHEELGLLTFSETHLAFFEAFNAIDGLEISTDALKWLNYVSYGHPYLMQLLGFFAIENLNTLGVKAGYTLEVADLKAIEDMAMVEYNQRVLKPMVGELSPLEVEYLKAMSMTLNDDRLASLKKVSGQFKQSSAELIETREQLIRDGIIALQETDKPDDPVMLMFCVPYLSKYVVSKSKASDVVAVARSRRV